MNGSRTKKLRKEAYPIYIELKKTKVKNLLPFKSIFKQIKRFYNAGLPIYKQTPVAGGISWPTKK